MKKPLALGILTFTLTVIGLVVLIGLTLEYRPQITSFGLANPYFIPILIIVWRAISIVIAPLPGGVLSFAFIPIIGWFLAWLYGSIGVVIGATLAFYLARKFREPFVKRFVPLERLHKLEEKMSQKTEFFAFLGIRLTTAPIMDFVSYIAGLSKISYKKFIAVTLIAQLFEGVWYYFGGVAFQKLLSAQSLFAGLILLVIIIIFFFIIKNHGIFRNKEIE